MSYSLTIVLAWLVASVFVLLAAWHVRMALSPRTARGIAVPSLAGRPLFVPSTRATLAVAILLLVFAVLVAAAAGILAVGVPLRVLGWLCYALALGLLARAVGDFTYVGLFKRVRSSAFARLDTQIFSPLCLGLAVAVAVIAFRQG
ncbi:MAG: DUF3995 domain-containing protein, partial [Burkholderiaceae bacterium]